VSESFEALRAQTVHGQQKKILGLMRFNVAFSALKIYIYSIKGCIGPEGSMLPPMAGIQKQKGG
jgi:hypothetical protein